ncbi:hypothetical protein C0992_009260, partial [Termitomyces sp. T32_za158]
MSGVGERLDELEEGMRTICNEVQDMFLETDELRWARLDKMFSQYKREVETFNYRMDDLDASVSATYDGMEKAVTTLNRHDGRIRTTEDQIRNLWDVVDTLQ